MLAIRHRSPKTAARLLSKGADISIKNRKGEDALDWAKQDNDPAMIQIVEDAIKAGQ